MSYRNLVVAFTLAAAHASGSFLNGVRGEDWPMWRHDAQRTGVARQGLAPTLHLQWVRQLSRLETAWPDQPKMTFDQAYEPVVLGSTMYVGSSSTDTMLALDTRTGAQKWSFHADGPIRFAPVAWEGNVYFVSDDGYLYCLDGGSGRLVWKFRGGPSDRKILGNGRLISTWPARGAPVIADGTVYFAASIWPFMGIFIHALDAHTGQVVWTNDGDGSMYIKQPHNADSFAGVAPQGPMTVQGDRLLIPGGRSVPACYDRKTGTMIYYCLAENAKNGGGTEVAVQGNLVVNGATLFDLQSGAYLREFGQQPVLAEDLAVGIKGGKLKAFDPRHCRREETETLDRKGNSVRKARWTLAEADEVDAPGTTALIRAGSRLYAASPGRVEAIELPLIKGQPASVSSQVEVAGTPVSLLAADDRLFAVTLEGRIYCFGTERIEPQTVKQEGPAVVPADLWTGKANRILQSSGVRTGYCIAWGVGTGRLLTELARQSQLHIIAVDPDVQKVESFRKQLIAAGLYGDRIAVHASNPMTFSFPPYLASLMVSEDLRSAGIEPSAAFVHRAFFSLRPFGGVACLPVSNQRQERFLRQVGEAGLVNAKVREEGDLVWLSREGALPGSANWTHEHADASNTRVSRDNLVKAPLGVLWFGGSSNQTVLPRHGHGPQPQVIDGRLIIEGVDMLRAVDIYTGQVLWESSLPGVGKLYNTLPHQTGANATGTNFVSTGTGIYAVTGKKCLRLDPATGKQLGEFTLPPLAGMTEAPEWGYLNVVEDYLVGGSYPATADSSDKSDDEDSDDSSGNKSDNRASSKQLVVMDRMSGKVRWKLDARIGFRHNSICLGGGRLYCIDRPSSEELGRARRRGEASETSPRLLVLDLETGKETWSNDSGIFGTWLSYSSKYDVLVEAGRMARDTLWDEAKGMRAYRAGTGAVLWHEKAYAGPAMIHGDVVLKDTSACDLLTGKPKMRQDPITGQPCEWRWTRDYGCNTPAASEHLLTFRSGAAGYFDLANDGGTGNFGGFRSSCTNNLIVAGGLLNAPDYTRNCTCSYQNQTSLGLIHMPEVETWTKFPLGDTRSASSSGYVKQTQVSPREPQAIKHIGLNLGAPGNHRAPDGQLWLNDYEHLRVAFEKYGYYNGHSSKISVSGPGRAWVAASGCRGITQLELAMKADANARYTLRLHFADPDNDQAGQRVFDVKIQGQDALKSFDIAREAGGRNRAIVKEFKGIRIQDRLVIRFLPAPTHELAERNVPLLCGLELVNEQQ